MSFCIQIGFGNVTLGCPECDCLADGSTERFCDTTSGQCPCKCGVEGLRCDRCQSDYYNLTADGCVGKFYHIFRSAKRVDILLSVTNTSTN